MPDGLNYSVWKNNHETILEGLKDKRFLMTFSGGKDSSLILHFIQKAASEFGFSFDPIVDCKGLASPRCGRIMDRSSLSR